MSPFRLPLWDRVHKARRDESGAIAIEFALIAPVFLLLCSGIVEGTLLFHTWGNMENISRQAARSAAIGMLTKDQAEALIKTRMQASTGAPGVTATVTFEKGLQPVDNAVTVNVTMPASELSKVLPFGIFRGFDLRTTTRTYWEIG
ncbi:TadE/TadG family type IV pilus assembly protein [Microvirga sp. 0TCS3.31]